MGFKNSIEIITKDIEELENLVSNLKNYSRIPEIEIDLALAKMQNIYELMLMVKKHSSDNNMLNENKEPLKDSGIKNESDPPSSETKSFKEDSTNQNQSEDMIFENPDVTFEREQASENKEKSDVKDTDLEVEKLPPKEQNEKILAEKLEKPAKYINEKIGTGNSGLDLSSKMQSKPIKSIVGSMGINDKFYFIRELFHTNAENFRTTMNTLDKASNFNEAYSFLLNNFEWDMESEPVQQLLSLVRRKFIRSENE